MAKNPVHLEGLSDLLDGLLELPKATQTSVQKRVLTKAAAPIKRDAQARAPYRTGLLKRKIVISDKLSSRQKRMHKPLSKIEIFVGPSSMARAIVGEFGSVRQAPSPFMRPAWDGNKQSALKSMRDDLAEEIEKARVRALRKTARLLAKKG